MERLKTIVILAMRGINAVVAASALAWIYLMTFDDGPLSRLWMVAELILSGDWPYPLENLVNFPSSSLSVSNPAYWIRSLSGVVLSLVAVLLLFKFYRNQKVKRLAESTLADHASRLLYLLVHFMALRQIGLWEELDDTQLAVTALSSFGIVLIYVESPLSRWKRFWNDLRNE